MTIEATVTYNHYTAPSVRRDFQDWFPQTREYFPGYIRTEVFRTTLSAAMHHAQVATNLEIETTEESHLNPMFRVNSKSAEERQREYGQTLKSNLLNEVQITTWFRWQPEKDIAAEMRQQSREYYMAATRGVAEKALDKVGGKVAKQVKKVGGQQLGKMIGQGKINEKLGKTLGKHGFGSHKIVEYKLKPKGFTRNLIDVDIDVSLPDKVVGDTLGTIADTMPTGIEVSLNNEDTRSWLTSHTGMNDRWAGRVMGTVDTIMDYVHITSAIKMVGEAGVNAYMGWFYGKEAAKIEQWQQESRKKRTDFDRRLKSAIANDIESLSGEELVRLMNLLK